MQFLRIIAFINETYVTNSLANNIVDLSDEEGINYNNCQLTMMVIC